jgi:hypothetical protein
MTPKEKAQELIHKFAKPIDALHKYPMCYETSKQCALIAVDEILYVLNEIDSTEQWNASWFYNEVKQEIEKL